MTVGQGRKEMWERLSKEMNEHASAEDEEKMLEVFA